MTTDPGVCIFQGEAWPRHTIIGGMCIYCEASFKAELRPLEVGTRVVVVEHNDRTREPLEGGDRHPATITALTELCVHVTYDDPAITGGRHDMFWRETLWRASDGWFRWRLQLVNPDTEER